jgi:hypothetical protein
VEADRFSNTGGLEHVLQCRGAHPGFDAGILEYIVVAVHLSKLSAALGLRRVLDPAAGSA